jgi:hypothetical protein
MEEMNASGQYKTIYVNKGLSNEIPGASPDRRPDIYGVRHDGTIDQVEVVSKTDDPRLLKRRMQENLEQMGEKRWRHGSSETRGRVAMSDKTVTVVALHGVVDDAPESWRSWLEFGAELGAELDHPVTHVGTYGNSFRSGKILTFGRVRARLLRALSASESLKWLTLYSLPPDFGSAFDFTYMAARHRSSGYMAISVRGGRRGLSEWVDAANKLRAHIKAERGEVFTMNQGEHVGGYLSRTKRLDGFKTLRVLKKF